MTQQKYIIIAEDEINIADFLKRGLEDSGYGVKVATNGVEAWQLTQQLMVHGEVELLLMDIRMPHMSGIEVCRLCREQYGYGLPILLLTALNTTDDIVEGLHAGADDYLPKPFRFAELLARVQALLRRAAVQQPEVQLPRCADLECNPSTHQARRGDLVVDLSTKEYRLLEYFIRNQGEVLTRRQLLRDVWDKDFDTNTNVVDVYVRYLRTKIDDPFDHRLIHTVVGVGYMMKSHEI